MRLGEKIDSTPKNQSEEFPLTLAVRQMPTVDLVIAF